MTSGGLTMTEGWNLQLQGRVRKLEGALQQIANMSAPTSPIGQVARAALVTVSEADIASALGEYD